MPPDGLNLRTTTGRKKTWCATPGKDAVPKREWGEKGGEGIITLTPLSGGILKRFYRFPFLFW